MTVAELKVRLAQLESKVETLQQQFDYAQALAGIKRGLEQADQGLVKPAREWAKKVRAKHKLTK